MYEGAMLTFLCAPCLEGAGSQSRQLRCWQYVLLTRMLFKAQNMCSSSGAPSQRTYGPNSLKKVQVDAKYLM